MSIKDQMLQSLFRAEFSKMVAVISKQFGLEHLAVAEDIVSATFLQAAETWETKGTPEKPAAWLYTVARQKTLYHFRRNKIYRQKVVPQIKGGETGEANGLDLDFSVQNIQDSQLPMMFAICDPVIRSEAQIGLALRILCGFGIDEIAEAFLTNKETINKRLFRAKEKLREQQVKLELPPEHEIALRLDNVLHIIYLLFNEGYYSTTHNQILRKDFCLEAMRLGLMLAEYPATSVAKTNALLALMCFHNSRFDARQNRDNDIILYDHQDENLWNKELIRQGCYFLELAAQGTDISSYHLEAAIAFWHCQKEDSTEKWQHILQYYDLLLAINYSPAVALNRIYALYKVKGKAAAILEAENLQLTGSHFYFTLLGELYTDIDNNQALMNYEKAIAMAKSGTDKQILQSKLDTLKNKGTPVQLG